ncbi:odorant receptor 13a [Orussus abietinus]|uniref:odorant receptor 13a n=1 Tax=Orussus abietinus TaxID=222816 RepID=UPI000626E09F|nr:odorant receptor 13a [Orussus abietinus]
MNSTEITGREEFDLRIKPIKIVMQVISLWPLKKDCSRYRIILKIFHKLLIIVITSTLSVAGFLDSFRQLDNMDEASECALIASAFALSTFRIAILSIHEKHLVHVVETMKSDWATFSYEDRAFLKEKCDFHYRLAKYFIFSVAMPIFFFIAIPALELQLLGAERRWLPFRGHFFINATVSPVYESLYIYEIIGGVFGGSSIAAVTTFTLVTVTHGAARFALVGRKLQSLKGDEPNAEELSTRYIKQHQDAIEFAGTLESAINVVALGQFLVSTGLVCFAGFQVTSMLEDKGRLMKYSAFLNSAILELFMFSFGGGELMDESIAVADSAYDSGWTENAPYAKSMQIIMMRSRVPCTITAAKFYSMSLKSFQAVLSTSFSYFTMLKAVDEK